MDQSVKPPGKLEVATSYLLERSLISPEANKLYFDSCLHSTVSALQNKYGLEFEKTTEPSKVFPKAKPFTRYKLSERSKPDALKLVQFWQKKRGFIRAI